MPSRDVDTPYGAVEVRIPVAELRSATNGAAALSRLTEQARADAGSRTLTGKHGYRMDGEDYVFTFPMTQDPNAPQIPALVLTDGE